MKKEESQEIPNKHSDEDDRTFKSLDFCLICNKKFKNLNGLSNHCKRKHNLKIKDYVIKNLLNGFEFKCKCGCENKVKWQQNGFSYYLPGHLSKTEHFDNPWSKKCRVPKNKILFSESDKILIKKMFINEHKTIREISKLFKCSISPIKSFLRKDLDLNYYFSIVRKNDSWRRINIPELNKKIRFAAAKGGMSFSKMNNTHIELSMKQILSDLNIKYNFQYFISTKDNKYCFDFYIPEKNILIECDGDYWHGNPKFYKTLNDIQIKNQQKDLRKNDFALKMGYKLIRFWEDEFKNKDLIKKNVSSYL